MDIIKLILLFLSVFMTLLNISKMLFGKSLYPMDFVYWALGISGFIYLQWL
jgi:hypothetical protein